MCITTFIYKDMQCNVNIPLHIFTKTWCIVNTEMPLSWYIFKLCNIYEKKIFQCCLSIWLRTHLGSEVLKSALLYTEN